jgi:thiamine pyrophosphate-dependent acetolactate synthase large subunit-like protein/nitrite reductase/ring-hydroxylating ferredoxin subunit
MSETAWARVATPAIGAGRVTTVVAGGRAVCLVHHEDGSWTALDNRCPHQGGPLGDGQLEDGYLICPWHAYQYDPTTGTPPPGFKDAAIAYPVRRVDGDRELEVQVPLVAERVSLMDQVVETLTDWGLDACFGMVGHSNLGMADALRKATEDGRLTYIGIRHEGAAAFAASGYAKLTGRPAACFTIAGPGATNLMTGLWDAKVDRVPILALTGQVQTQVIGPGTFQELPLDHVFRPVAEYTQTILSPANATELAALAMKHAIVQRDVAHLVLPDEVQELPGVAEPTPRPVRGRLAATAIAPPEEELQRAIELLRAASKPAIVIGNGARPHRDAVRAFAEHLDAPVISTFKAKGTMPDDHPLGCGVLGRSGIPVASQTVAEADCLLVLGASFSNHTSIPEWVPTIQVDLDRMILGKFHPVEVALWGDIARTLALLRDALPERSDAARRSVVAARWERWRREKARRRDLTDAQGRLHPALVFEAMSEVVPDDAIVAVDVGNNTYSFGHFFECRGRQDVLMSGYLGSIGFALPAAIGASVAVRRGGAHAGRKVVSISGDGGLGQYLAELTTAVKYHLPLTHVVLDNGELAKISREQLGAIRPVWETNLVNPDLAAYAELCGARGFRVASAAELRPALDAAFAVTDGPSLVAISASNRDV